MFAAIDIGTNSVRLLIAKYENKKLLNVFKEVKTTRLGEGVASSGILTDEAMERTVAVLRNFREVCKKYRVEKLRVVATSAVRDALNRELFLEKVFKAGLKVEVISGEEEAWLSFIGATGLTQEKFNPLVVDIGGGSTEIIYDFEGKLRSTSIPAGAVRCTEEKWSPEKIQKKLHPVLEKIVGLKDKKLIGVGGTITTLAAVDQKLSVYDPDLVQGYTLSLERIMDLEQYLSSLTLEERRQVPGLQPARADIITSGIQILLAILKGLQVQQITVSDRDILDGIILRMAHCPKD